MRPEYNAAVWRARHDLSNRLDKSRRTNELNTRNFCVLILALLLQSAVDELFQ
jgi:hypothetical protein